MLSYNDNLMVDRKISSAAGVINERIDRKAKAGVAERAELKSRLDAQQVQIDALHFRLSNLERPSPSYRLEGVGGKEVKLVRVDDPTSEMQKDIKAYFVANRRSRKPVSEVTEEIAAWLFSLGYKKG